MAGKLYPLLVGIDEYRDQPLRGCVNDVCAMEEFLGERASGADWTLAPPLRLLNSDATRAAVIEGFRSYLTQAGPEDIALFYYSGHGSQEPSPEEFWALEPDRLDETL